MTPQRNYEKRTPDQSTWKRPTGETTHSFKAFVAQAKTNKHGREHLKRHHGGHGL